MASPFAGPSSPRKLTGSTPGVLDSTQPDRLLTFSKSSLSFASFNPRTATSSHLTPDARKLSLNEELYNPKRVVIEMSPTGESFWRFVPKARTDEGVIDEGDWPRVVDVCGTLYECSQDQWDIYKLDPLYDCHVRVPPALSTITRASIKPPTSPHSNGKRNATKAGIPLLKPRKKRHIGDGNSSLDLDDEVEEVEDMVIDQSMPPPPPRARSASLRKKREEILQIRQQRRENISRRAEKLSSREDAMYFDFSINTSSERSQSVPVDAPGKRKATMLVDPLRATDREPEEDWSRTTLIYEQTAQRKRTRKVSPGAAKRELDIRRAERDKRRQKRRQARLIGRRQQWHEQFMQEVYAEVPDLKPPSTDIPIDNDNGEYDVDDDDSDDESSSGGPSPDTSFDESATRAAAIAESRRKLAELEVDRPLWEEEARKRALREKAAEESQRLKAEERKWADMRRAEAKARQAAEAQEIQEQTKQQREAELQEHLEREEAAKRQRERRKRDERWTYGSWTSIRALERYKVLSDAFDTTKFNAYDPLTFHIVPWPILTSPTKMSVEDVDWNAVESFFAAVRPHMRSQEFQSFVEKSQRRFHPDRWRARGLLRTVKDEAERGCLEVAATTVAQALTPLWRDITGR